MTEDEARDALIGLVERKALPPEVASRASATLGKILRRPSACDRVSRVRAVLVEPHEGRMRLVVELGCDRAAWPACVQCPDRFLYYFRATA